MPYRWVSAMSGSARELIKPCTLSMLLARLICVFRLRYWGALPGKRLGMVGVMAFVRLKYNGVLKYRATDWAAMLRAAPSISWFFMQSAK